MIKKFLLTTAVIIGSAALSASDMDLNDPFFVGKSFTAVKKAYCEVVNKVVTKNVDLLEIKDDIKTGGHTHFDNKKTRICDALGAYLDDVLDTAGNGGNAFSAGGHVIIAQANQANHGTDIVMPASDSRDDLKNALILSVGNMTFVGENNADQACEANAVPAGISPFVHYYTKVDAIQHAFLDRLERAVTIYVGDALTNQLTVADGTNGMKCKGQNTAVRDRHTGAFLKAPVSNTGQAFLDALKAVLISVGD